MHLVQCTHYIIMRLAGGAVVLAWSNDYNQYSTRHPPLQSWSVPVTCLYWSHEVRASQLAQASERVGSPIPASQ